jgi:LacI family transcriptional regulator
MATIRDVAIRAGVSVATVSHVMNESRFVAPETKARVLSAISELDYRRDGIARSLRRNRTGAIGAIISDITNPFFADLVKGIDSVVHDLRDPISVILCNTEEDAAKELFYIEALMERRIDGLIAASAGGNERALRGLAERSFPLVLVDRLVPRVDCDCVTVDNLGAARDAVGHLVARGHRRIAALRATLNASSISERIEGYRCALVAAGLPVEPTLIVESESNVEDARRAGLRLLEQRPIPDAVFCTNNFMTLGLMRALNERGMTCPEDIAIVGFDDFQWADAFRPRITAVAQPAFEMGAEAARLLMSRIDKSRSGPSVRLTLPTSLRVRDSST